MLLLSNSVLHSKVSNSKHSSLTSFSSSNTILDKRATALFVIRILFAGEGVNTNILLELGLITTAVNFIALDIALYTGLTYAYILLMIFSLQRVRDFDTNQLEAAKDLGSSTVRTHWRIVIPHAKAGIASGCTMVFVLTAGALATPVVLSSPNTYWFTQRFINGLI